MKPGSRYWYYYIVDGYHVSHDPAKEFVVEKTTGRKLNILDIPAVKKPSSSASTAAAVADQKPSLAVRTTNLSKRHSREIPQGRPLTPTKIAHPKPQKPHASRGIREADYEVSPVEELESRFAATELSRNATRYSPMSASTLSSGSEASGTVFSSSPSQSSCSDESESSEEDSRCRCNRYGLTRSGQRVKLDCGGKRCGYASSSEEESESDSEDEAAREAELKRRAREKLQAERLQNGYKKSATVTDSRRHGMVMSDSRRRK